MVRMWPRLAGTRERGAELPGMQRRLRRFNREVREDEISAAYFEEWVEDVRGRKQWGPSPVEAQRILGCGRANVDALVERGVLECNEYERDGHKLIVISWRSLKKAKENKRKYGSYTGQSVGRPSLKPEPHEPTSGSELGLA